MALISLNLREKVRNKLFVGMIARSFQLRPFFYNPCKYRPIIKAIMFDLGLEWTVGEGAKKGTHVFLSSAFRCRRSQ